MKFNFVFLSSILIFAEISSGADQYGEKEKWFQCQKDDECIELNYSCFDQVVNRKFQEIANKHFEKQSALMECDRRVPTDAQKKVPYKVFCENKTCKSQGVNPKSNRR